jgi:hypothetical protein
VPKSVPARRTIEVKKGIHIGARAFISCKVLDVSTGPKLPGID